MSIDYGWRGHFENHEVSTLHAEAFPSAPATEHRDWQSVLAQHSLGWVLARDVGQLVGFVNVIWDGSAHAWIQDVMVAASNRRQGIGTRLIAMASNEATRVGCEWLHVDFDDGLGPFYLAACGFSVTSAGLLRLRHDT